MPRAVNVGEEALISTGMSTVITRPELKGVCYELLTHLTAVVAGGLGVPFYMEANAKAGWMYEASSISTNVPGIVLFTKKSIDYLWNLYEKGQYGKIAAILIPSAVLYSPQLLISWMESKKSSEAWRVFALASTFVSGLAMTAFAVAQIPGMYVSAKAVMNDVTCFGCFDTDEKTKKENANINLNRLKMMFLSGDISTVSDTPITEMTKQQLLNQVVNVAKTAPNPCVEDAGWLPGIAQKSLGAFFASLMLFGTMYSYGCGTDKSLQQDFNAPPKVAYASSLVLLSFQYLLNLTGGFGLANTIVETSSLLLNYRRFPNDKKLGGQFGLMATITLGLMAAFISSFSGGPTYEFGHACKDTILASTLPSINRFFALMLPFMDGNDPMLFARVAAMSICLFNAIFAAQCFYSVQEFIIKRAGSERDKNFLFLNEKLNDLHGELKKTPADKVSALFESGSNNNYISPSDLVADVDDREVPSAVTSAVTPHDENSGEIDTSHMGDGVDEAVLIKWQDLCAPKDKFVGGLFQSAQALSNQGAQTDSSMDTTSLLATSDQGCGRVL